jgi:hypothetical protein
MSGHEQLFNYIQSGDIEELNEANEDRIRNDDDRRNSESNYNDEDEDNEPQAKRFRSDFDSSDSNDVDLRFSQQPGIPSLLNINVGHPNTQDSQKSPNGPWENNNHNANNNSSSNNNNGAFGNNNQQRNRENRRGSRWSSRR